MKVAAAVAALGLTSAVSACVTHEERAAEAIYKRTGTRPAKRDTLSPRASSAYPIGTGDRFDGGNTAPVGLGVDDRTLDSILTVDEVTSALKGLNKAYPELTLFTPPFKTYEGRELPGAIVGDNPRVFIMSGIHARERGGPDSVVYFMADLLNARKAGKGVTYGSKSYTAADVEKALSAGIVILPITNPDGVAYDQKSDSCWRKNRNPESSSGSDDTVGIDLNRNYDFVWDFTKAFDPSADPASEDPSSETFHGTAAESEPETKSVVWTVDQYQNITWFMDLHSYGPDLLYGWGDDDVGTTATDENFVNSKYDGVRGITGDSAYKEYFTPADFQTEKTGTSQIIASMNKVGGVTYDAHEAVGLYPTSGASNDYAMGRYYGKLACGASRMFGYTLEFGQESSADPSCPFYPNENEYHRNIRQIGAGFVEMLLIAAGEAGDPLYLEC